MPGIKQITLPELIQLIEEYEGVPKTAEKPKSKVTVNKTAAVGKTELPKKTKTVEAKKKVAPVAKVEAKKSKAPRGKVKEGYTPQKDSMRQFIYGALQQGTASVTRIKQRAAKLAAKAGVKQYSTEESYKAFDVKFFVKALEEKGITVERDGEKMGITI